MGYTAQKTKFYIKDSETTSCVYGRDKSNKVVVKSFYGPNISQIKWHAKPDTEENHQNFILNCSTNDINDNAKPQVRVEEIMKLIP